jgi:predicted aldo/keto reductase-like oxidoreductase
MRRRHFLGLALAAAAAQAIPSTGEAKSKPKGKAKPGPKAKAAAGPVPKRKLGRTGELVSCVGLGGYHIGRQKNEAESIGLIRSAIDGGITFLDNSWDYNDGASELRMGKALKDGYRQKAFLMTKIDGRDWSTFMIQLESSLQRLQTDHVDLIQFHEVIRPDDPDRIFQAKGALQAALDARKAGKVRFIGFSGHKSPDIHLKMLDLAARNGFRFDTVQMPLNVMDAHYQSFENKVLPRLVQDEIGVLGMKSMGDPFILQSRTVSAAECLQYALSLPTSVVITGIDSKPILQQALQVAGGYEPLTAQQRAALLAKTATAAKDGRFEKYKTTTHFDATVQHPHWLG